MALDASVRKQLVEAREVILAEIEEIECRAKTPSKGGPPDYRGPYAELQKQLHEIDELLGPDADEDPHETRVITPGYFGGGTVDADRSKLATKVVLDPAREWNMNAILALAAAATLGAGVGVAMHHPVVGIFMGVGFGGSLAALAKRSN